MKIKFVVLFLFFATISNAQSNKSGTIQLGINGGVFIAGVNTDMNLKSSDLTENNGDPGFGASFAFRAQYGISKRFSAGLYLRKQADAFVADNSSAGAYFSEYELTIESLIYGVELKYYPVCNERFAFYLAPYVGISDSKTNFMNANKNNGGVGNQYIGDDDGTASGINFGLTAGINWYWTDYIGMSADLGINASSLDGEFSDPSYKDLYEYETSTFGIVAQIGIITKFGGKK